ncbi:MAG: hypothetical protein KDE56_27515 [Anaerolineales bacterium]|nr:hypothetical protein [Anaerolineales bacterium]
MFQPLRERLQRSVNRFMFGERDDPYKVLSQLGRQLGRNGRWPTLSGWQIPTTLPPFIWSVPHSAVCQPPLFQERQCAAAGVGQPLAVPIPARFHCGYGYSEHIPENDRNIFPVRSR